MRVSFHQMTCAGVIAAQLLLWSELTAQYLNVRVSNASSTSPEEVTIAINPTNPLNLVAGANIRFFYYSTNGGYNWTQGQLPSGTWGDPCVTFDANGRAYYGHLSFPAGGYFIERLIVHRSSNGGMTWYDSADVGYNPPKQQDKEWLIADMTNSPYRNNIYMLWTEFDSYASASPLDSTRILFSRSTNGGTTWSTPQRISEQGGNCIDSDSTVEGAVPAVGPNGEIYTAWSGPLGIMFDKSTDGGLTWGTDVFVSFQPGGWDFDVSGIYRTNGIPITVCDVSNSPHRGNVYVGWSDQRNGLTDTDIFFIKSTDSGLTWGQVKRVNDDIATAHQFFTWMTVDQSTGYVYFVFYDRRGTVGNATDVYLARSTDGGETLTNFRVSQSSFTPNASIFFGDYTGIAASNRKVYPIWMRMDGTNLSVWTALVDDSLLVLVPGREQPPTEFALLQNYPNPFNPITEFEFCIGRLRFVSLKVFDILGREVATLVAEPLAPGSHTIEWMPTGLPSGVYFYRLQTGGFSETRKLILLE